ncbi:dihydroorotase [Lentibacillus sediminis]|uniref:dihydroorotase n=1 Tax=Lentibacillus sediminis TaxID=1940529 RepID=UPI000C1B9734|nr:dihydroorotase [Lentibacillus sediminis]
MKLLLTNAKLLEEKEGRDILIEGGKIKKIAPSIAGEADEVIDCEGKIAVPGFIDVHIHLREPGGEHKETIRSGTLAAARGGFTTVCAMPNTNPVPDNQEHTQALLDKIKKDAKVRVLPYAAITKGLEGEALTDMAELAEIGVFAFTDDGVGVQDADRMYRAMEQAAACGKPIIAHCEENSLVYGGVLHDGKISRKLSLPGIPSLSESVQIARDVLLAEAAGCHYHVCHVSTKESVRVIRDAKEAGINVTAEVTPHHLLLNEEDIAQDDADFKMNPPLRSKADQDALLEGLLDGTIDLIATDHAPHAKEEKELGFLEAPFGITGLETAFSLLHTKLVLPGTITLKQLINWLTVKPAKIFHLPYGELKEGASADITVLDLQTETVIDREGLLSKGKNTPFHNWNVTGIPVLTIAKGNTVYRRDEHV